MIHGLRRTHRCADPLTPLYGAGPIAPDPPGSSEVRRKQVRTILIHGVIDHFLVVAIMREFDQRRILTLTYKASIASLR